MQSLVLTIAIGAEYQRMAEITHPSLKAYAARCGADFHSITVSSPLESTPHWAKGTIGSYFGIYDRVLYLDTDILVRDDCPNLFDLVPEEHLGAFNEAPFTHRSQELIIDCCKAYGLTLPRWDGRYFNTGVMVASRVHEGLFTLPEQQYCSFYEQTYLNMQIAALETPMYELPYKFNRMTCVDSLTGEHRLASYIVHYAGAQNTETVIQLVQQDARRWQQMRGRYECRRHIHVSVTGGLGDQACAEPALRYMAERVYPDAEIVVSTHFPELFTHLPVRVYQQGTFTPESDTPYYLAESLPPPESINWMVCSNLLSHTVDFCSSALLRRTLPLADKRAHLLVRPDDRHAIAEQLMVFPDGAVVAVHAGRHWNTKTFPVDWWQAVVDGLVNAGAQVCLIGNNEETRGTVPVVCRNGILDLRDQLTLGQLMALLEVATVLVSNDSAPIHIAGAFDNGIVLIPSCKHPDHILPWRYGSMAWRTVALYKRLTIDDVSSQPTDIHGVSAEFDVADWSRYLPEPCDVIAETLKLSGDVTYA